MTTLTFSRSDLQRMSMALDSCAKACMGEDLRREGAELQSIRSRVEALLQMTKPHSGLDYEMGVGGRSTKLIG